MPTSTLGSPFKGPDRIHSMTLEIWCVALIAPHFCTAEDDEGTKKPQVMWAISRHRG